MARSDQDGESHGRARVSATEAARNFSELLNRVRYRRQSFLVERGGQAVCEIRPVYETTGFTGADLARLLKALPRAPETYVDAVEDILDRQPPAEETRWPRS
jgi:hypothetical protein